MGGDPHRRRGEPRVRRLDRPAPWLSAFATAARRRPGLRGRHPVRRRRWHFPPWGRPAWPAAGPPALGQVPLGDQPADDRGSLEPRRLRNLPPELGQYGIFDKAATLQCRQQRLIRHDRISLGSENPTLSAPKTPRRSTVRAPGKAHAPPRPATVREWPSVAAGTPSAPESSLPTTPVPH